ncbi:19919_t:CDS:2, partial [Dentiscutata erythropus]
TIAEHASKLDALISDWKTCKKGKLTIEKRAKYCATASDVIDIFAHHLDLGPKNKDENEIVASGSCQSQFRVKLAEARKRMANPDRIPIHFSLARVSKRLQNMDVSKIPTKGDLVDVIVMLSMRPAEVRSLQINYYEPDPSNIPAWYKDGYSWYCMGYLKSRGEKKKNPVLKPLLSMEKNPERARELLTWIQEAIKARKLHDLVFTESGKRNDTPFNEFLKQEPYKTLPGKLRDYGSKHASRIHGGDNYAIGNTESEKSDSEPETSDSPKPQTQASSPSQAIKMDSILAEIDAILAEIQK